MKRIELVVEPGTLDSVIEAAGELNLSDFNVAEVRRTSGSSNRQGRRLYRGREFVLDMVERFKLDLTVEDDAAMQIACDLNRRVRPESIVILSLEHAVVVAGEGAAGSTRTAVAPNPGMLSACTDRSLIQ